MPVDALGCTRLSVAVKTRAYKSGWFAKSYGLIALEPCADLHHLPEDVSQPNGAGREE